MESIDVYKRQVYASEATGMNISVERISLSFPLNLVVTDVDAASPHNDTLLSVCLLYTSRCV